jgi:hypothetical protein
MHGRQVLISRCPTTRHLQDECEGQDSRTPFKKRIQKSIEVEGLAIEILCLLD